MDAFRRFLATPAGKACSILFSLALVAFAGYMIYGFFKGDEPGDPNTSVYVCSETGKSFKHRNEIGETPPILSPYSGKNTGYPGEPCYWTKEGTLRKEPYWLLLNETLGKSGPTFCPDCGRLVTPRGSVPGPNSRPRQRRKKCCATSSCWPIAISFEISILL